MQYQFLGKTGVLVSPLCFGTMSFGGVADEPTSRAMFNMCRDAGINFFDCANVYEKGGSEEVLRYECGMIRYEFPMRYITMPTWKLDLLIYTYKNRHYAAQQQ